MQRGRWNRWGTGASGLPQAGVDASIRGARQGAGDGSRDGGPTHVAGGTYGKVQFTPPGRLQTRRARQSLVDGKPDGSAFERGHQYVPPIPEAEAQRDGSHSELVSQPPLLSQPSLDANSGLPLAGAGPKKSTESSVNFLVRWINYLCGGYLGWTPLTPDNLLDDLKTGLVLCRIVERLVPSADFTRGLNMRPKTRKTCVQNIDRALQVVWKQGINSSQMCTADDFYDGNAKKVIRCLVAMFDVLQMRLREIRLRAREVTNGMQRILQSIRPLSAQTVSDPLGFGHHLLSDFADGHRLLTLLVAAGKAPPEDLRLLRGCCVLQDHWLENGEALNNALSTAGCPVLLSPSEWMNPPPPFPDTLMFQIYLIWQVLVKQDFDGRRLRAQTREDHISTFFALLSSHFNSLEEVCHSMASAGSPRISRESFMRVMRSLDYPGDSKYVWDCLDANTVGWVEPGDFMRLAQAQQESDGRALLDRAHRTGPAATRYPSPRPAPGGLEASGARPGHAAHEDPDDGVRGSQAVAGGGVAGVASHQGKPDASAFPPPEPEFAFEVVADHMASVRVALEGGRDAAWVAARVGDAEARLVNPAEERSWLYAEDTRRHLELYELGRIATAQQAAEASQAGTTAAEEALENLDKDPDLSAALTPKKGRAGRLGPNPTTCIDAWVLQTDSSTCRMWAQTCVVERPQDEDEEYAPPALVVEFRERCTDGSGSGKLRAQIDAARILAVEKLQQSDEDYIAFAVRFEAGADFLGGDGNADATEAFTGMDSLPERISSSMRLRPCELRRVVGETEVSGPSFFHPGPRDQGAELAVHIRVGPSRWRHRAGTSFFDELRMILHFTANAKQIMANARKVENSTLDAHTLASSQPEQPPASPRGSARGSERTEKSRGKAVYFAARSVALAESLVKAKNVGPKNTE